MIHPFSLLLLLLLLQSLCSRTPLNDRMYLSKRRVITKLTTAPFQFKPVEGSPPPGTAMGTGTLGSTLGSTGNFSVPSGSPDRNSRALPLSPAQVQMAQNIEAVQGRTSEVEGTLFRIDYEPLGSRQRQKRSVCKVKTF